MIFHTPQHNNNHTHCKTNNSGNSKFKLKKKDFLGSTLCKARRKLVFICVIIII